jgi:hypothetical protein
LNDAMRRDNFVGFKVDKLSILKDGKHAKQARIIIEEILI